MRRVNIAVDGSIAERLATEARKSNKTLFALANECLDLALRVLENGGEISHVPELLAQKRFFTELNLHAIPASLLENMIGKLYRGFREDLLAAWRNTGRELATYFRMYTTDIRSATATAKKIWGLKKFDVLGEGDKLELHSVGNENSQEFSECWAATVAGFCGRYGYAAVGAEIAPGFVRMLLEKTTEPYQQQDSSNAFLRQTAGIV